MTTRHLALTLFFALLALALVVTIARLETKVTSETVDEVGDQLALTLRMQLDKEKEEALRFALLLSQNGGLIDALDAEDEEVGYRILSSTIHKVREHTQTLIRAQVITADYRLFARSWDELFAGMPLDDYRTDLFHFQTHRRPRASLEIGRRLGIKATVPVYRDRRSLGFVEALQFFDTTTAFFRSLGIDLYVLMDYDYYDVAVLMQNNPTVGTFIIANRLYSAHNLGLLERLDYKALQQRRALLDDDRYVFYEPMHNGAGKKIGIFVMVMPASALHRFAAREEIGILINFSRRDLYEIVREEERRFYRSGYDEALLYLKDTVAEEDRELFMEEAREILEGYGKEELIAMILGYNRSRKIEGEIR